MDANEAQRITENARTVESVLNKTLYIVKGKASDGKEVADVFWDRWWGSKIPWREVEEELRKIGYYVKTYHPEEGYSSWRISWGDQGKKDKIDEKFDEQDKSMIPIVLLVNPISLILAIVLSVCVLSYAWIIWLALIVVVLPCCLVLSSKKRKAFINKYCEKLLT